MIHSTVLHKVTISELALITTWLDFTKTMLKKDKSSFKSIKFKTNKTILNTQGK